MYFINLARNEKEKKDSEKISFPLTVNNIEQIVEIEKHPFHKQFRNLVMHVLK